MLTFYGVLPRMYSCFGRQIEMGLVVDVMTSPTHQGKGLFIESSNAALARLKCSQTIGVIGFPIRNEVMPGHLRVGWKVQFEMPIYILPVGRSECKNFKKLIFKIFAILFEFGTRPLRGPMLKNRSDEIVESFSIDVLSDFYNSQKSNNHIVLEKSREFLKWRLNRPGIEYKFFFCESDKIYAVAISRQMILNGFRTLAILDFESESQRHSRQLVRRLVEYSIEKKIEVIAFSTNKDNSKRLGLSNYGFLKSHKKFKVITRSISYLASNFTTASNSSFRMTWMDSDTV